MKTQDIRNMALALQAVEEASKKKMDPVGREDGDIDNDGDKDKSDSYLHNRRKAISSAIKGKGTKETVTMEEVEELDELSKKTLGSYVKKAAKDIKDRAQDAYGEYGYGTHAAGQKQDDKADRRIRGVVKATNKLTREEVEELDELSKKTLGSYVKKASRNLAGREYKRGAEKDTSTANLQKSYKRDMGISKAIDKMTKEETSWPVFARIQEKVNQTKGATKPESMEDRLTASDKKMVDGHGGLGKKTPQDFVDDDQIDKNTELFNASNVKVAPKRHNDQTVGDKTMPKAK